MRLYSYLFHTLLALFLLAISILALVSGSNTLHIGVLPWDGTSLTYWLFFGSLFALLSIFLAIRRKFRFLFFLWSVAVPVMLLRGYIFSPYHFETGEFGRAASLILASLVAAVGAWYQMRRHVRREQWEKARVSR